MRIAHLALPLAVAAASLTFAAPVASAADSGTCPVAAGSYAGGVGSSADPYLISTPEEFQLLRDTPADWSSNFTLTDDIDMGGCVWGTTMGMGGTLWTGSFDGDQHVISGLDISIDGLWAGLFSYVFGGTVKDLGFTGNVTTTVAQTDSGVVYAGGLVGVAERNFFLSRESSITGSFSTGDVNVSLTVNGLIQHPDDDGRATAIVYAGGLVADSRSSTSIIDSFATGDVNVTVTATGVGTGTSLAESRGGGLIAYNRGLVAGSYSTGSVNSSVSASGGGLVEEKDVKGGFLGFDNSGTLTDNAWNTTTSGLTTGIVNITSPDVTGLTSAQMAVVGNFGPSGLDWSIGKGFSPATTWSLCPGVNLGFPYLSGFYIEDPCPFIPPPAPPAPTPAQAPDEVLADPGPASAVVSWSAPGSPGSFPVSNYEAVTLPQGGRCLVPFQQTSCELVDLHPGTEYEVRVRALTGAGWGQWSQPVTVIPEAPTPRASMLITGSRSGAEVVVQGETTGLDGQLVTPWVRFPGPHSYEPGAGVLVGGDGGFSWQRHTRNKVYVYFTAEGGERSNRVIIRP